MKPMCLLFLVLLFCSRLISLTDSCIDESIVMNYVVERRSFRTDAFFVNTKNGTQCTNGIRLHEWCLTFGAYVHPYRGSSPSSCSCICAFDTPSFIPSLKGCVKGDKLPTNLGGCPKDTYPNLIGVDNNPVFKFPVDLSSGMDETTTVSSEDYKCSLSGYYFDYNGFRVRWERVTNGIFKLKEKQHQFFIQGQDKHNNLSGRIIKLNLTCINMTKQKEPRKEFCYLLKAAGTVTYYAPKSTSLVNVFPTKVIRSSPTPVCLFSPSSHRHNYQVTNTDYAPKSTSLVNVFPTTVIRSSPTPVCLFSPSSHRHNYQVTNTGIPTSSVSTKEPNYSEPSELPTMESSLPTGDGTGDKEEKAREKNKVAIGAGVGGGLVAFGIIVVGVIIVFCKRRKSRKNPQKETKPAVITRNPVVEMDDQIQMESPIERDPTSSEKDSQSTYQGLVNNSGKSNGEARRNTSEDNPGYCHLYQCVNKNTPVTGAPVYQNVSAPVTVPDYQNVQAPVAAPNYQNGRP